MRTSDFDFDLPPKLIAQSPPVTRGNSRLLVVNESSLRNHAFADFIDYCEQGDLLLLNNTRVVPARLMCTKPSGGKVEVLLERFLNEKEFLAMARTNKSLKAGQVLMHGEQPILEYIKRQGLFFVFRIHSQCKEKNFGLFNKFGQTPLPPYLDRETKASDVERYQTVYAKNMGAVAAPTAGLHFDQPLLSKLQDKGVELGYITLHVGAGTFLPVKETQVLLHKMHYEWYDVDQSIIDNIERTKARGGRVIAVGTTTVRALESMAITGKFKASSGLTNIFIYPGFQFKLVDGLLTNFHLPKSTLLMMVSAFSGFDRIKSAYAHAIAHHYRFFSYGDAMFLNYKTNQ